MFFALIDKAQHEFNLLEEAFLGEVKTRDNIRQEDNHKHYMKKMQEFAQEAKKQTQKLQTILEQYKE